MKKLKLLTIVLISILICNQAFGQRKKKDQLENGKDSLSYAIGVTFATSIKKQNVKDLNVEKIALALSDVLEGEESKMNINEAQAYIQTSLRRIQEESSQKNLIKANEFLEDNRKKEGIVTLPSGLQYKVLAEGNGVSPTAANKVSTHYKGTLLDGTVFDSSYESGKPITFGVTRVIKAWQEALQLMKPGAKWILYVHPDLGYGERGSGPIPPNSLLIFEIELLSVE